MLCQNCKKNEATTHIKRIVNGETTQAHLCADCAKSLGYDSMFSDLGFGFGDMLSSFFNDTALASLGAHQLHCEKCGSTFSDIINSGRIGCADCYETFYDKLLPMLERIHGKTNHIGKIPNSFEEIAKEENVQSEAEKLKVELDEAVRAQNYEKAAELRDRIKELESEEGKDE